MAHIAERFGASVAVPAIHAVVAEYPAYLTRARQAGHVLREENNAAALCRALSET